MDIKVAFNCSCRRWYFRAVSVWVTSDPCAVRLSWLKNAYLQHFRQAILTCSISQTVPNFTDVFLIHCWDITASGFLKQTSAILEFYFRFRFLSLHHHRHNSASAYQILSKLDHTQPSYDVIAIFGLRSGFISRSGWYPDTLTNRQT